MYLPYLPDTACLPRQQNHDRHINYWMDSNWISMHMYVRFGDQASWLIFTDPYQQPTNRRRTTFVSSTLNLLERLERREPNLLIRLNLLARNLTYWSLFFYQKRRHPTISGPDCQALCGHFLQSSYWRGTIRIDRIHQNRGESSIVILWIDGISLSRYSLVYGHTITYDVAPPYSLL